MNYADFYASVVLDGGIFELRVGDDMERFNSLLRLDFLEEVRGRKHSRVMRRDYGFFEANFNRNEASWSCSSIILEVHRLRRDNQFTEKVSALAGVDLPSRVPWAEVAGVIEAAEKYGQIEEVERDGEYDYHRFRRSGATVHVLANPRHADSEAPQPGDIWSIELVHPTTSR